MPSPTIAVAPAVTTEPVVHKVIVTHEFPMALPIALQIEEGLLQSKGLKRNAKKSSRSIEPTAEEEVGAWTPDDAAAAGWTEGEAEGDDAEAWPPEAVDGHAEGTPEHWAAETEAGEAEVTASWLVLRLTSALLPASLPA